MTHPTATKTRTLDQLDRGERARIVCVNGQGATTLCRRLMDMGLTKGADIRVDRHAPLGDPMQINVKGYRLAVRLSEARHILVESMDAGETAPPAE